MTLVTNYEKRLTRLISFALLSPVTSNSLAEFRAQIARQLLVLPALLLHVVVVHGVLYVKTLWRGRTVVYESHSANFGLYALYSFTARDLRLYEGNQGRFMVAMATSAHASSFVTSRLARGQSNNFQIYHTKLSKFLVSIYRPATLEDPYLVWMSRLFGRGHRVIFRRSNDIRSLYRKRMRTTSWDLQIRAFRDSRINLALDEESQNKAELQLSRLGVVLREPIVTVLVRDNSWRRHQSHLFELDEYQPENSRLPNFADGIRSLCARGIQVVLMGRTHDQTMEAIAPNFFSLAHLRPKERSEVEIYLASTCDGSVSTGSGWDVLPAAFMRRSALVEQVEWPYRSGLLEAYLSRAPRLLSFKKWYFKTSTKSWREIFPWQVPISAKRISRSSLYRDQEGGEYRVVESSAERILEVFQFIARTISDHTYVARVLRDQRPILNKLAREINCPENLLHATPYFVPSDFQRWFGQYRDNSGNII